MASLLCCAARPLKITFLYLAEPSVRACSKCTVKNSTSSNSDPKPGSNVCHPYLKNWRHCLLLTQASQLKPGAWLLTWVTAHVAAAAPAPVGDCAMAGAAVLAEVLLASMAAP